WAAYLGALDLVSLPALAIGAGSLALIVGLRKVSPSLPGYLIAIVAASLAVAVLGLPVDTIGSRFPDMPSGLPMPSLPDLSLAKIQAVLPSAFTIAFLAGIEALLSAVVADGMAGTRSRVAGIFHAAFLLIFVLFAMDLMAYVPMAALAAILFMVALGMSEYERFISLLRMPNGDRVVLLLTFLLTVFVDLTVAIGV